MAYHQPFQITGFHSCDREIGLAVLNGKKELNHSNNDWDWLGGGVYFWEQNPMRALEYAEECRSGAQKNKIPVKTPFVLGAIIELGNCLNLMEPMSLGIIESAHNALKEVYKNSGEKLPINKGANRKLDCAVIKYVHETRRETNQQPYDTIRCPFQEGLPVYETSNFTKRLHIEICVINRDLIKGYFLPRPIADFNPYL
ncbi:MAG: hypothetical protein QM763_21895 [Agriterribacter sp.]